MREYITKIERFEKQTKERIKRYEDKEVKKWLAKSVTHAMTSAIKFYTLFVSKGGYMKKKQKLQK